MAASLRSILAKPFALMGIVNITPDSFYDGGAHFAAGDSITHARRLIEQGADVIDIGGESSRPGAAPVPAEEECRRILPVIENLAGGPVPISVDTTKASVAGRALDAGASWINDISAGRFDPAMAPLAARRKCPVILMHSRRTPETMQEDPSYADVVAEVKQELMGQVRLFLAAGVDEKDIVLDPGIGFAKRFEDNIEILNRIQELTGLGFPLLLGTSRKSTIGRITGKQVQDRLAGSLGSVASAFARGVTFFRVHDVEETRDLLTVMSVIDKRITCRPGP